MQNGFNVDDTPAYIKVAKGAAGNAAVQLPQEPAYTPPPETDYFAQQFGPDVYSPTPAPAYTPPEPVYTPPPEPDYFAQQFGGGETAGGGYGGYGIDDRYYEQMFAKGGLINLLRRR